MSFRAFGPWAISMLSISGALTAGCSAGDSGADAGATAGTGGSSAGTSAAGSSGVGGSAGKGGGSGTGGANAGTGGAAAGSGGASAKGGSGGAGATGGGSAGKAGSSAGSSGNAGASAGTGGSAGASGAGAAGAAGAAGGGGSGGCGSPTLMMVAPPTLSATGLYADIAKGTITSTAMPYTPRFTLWADSAEKKRWLSLPACSQIDTSNMDVWSFPVGTTVWKEFDVGGVRVETRLEHRYGPGDLDYLFAAYAWRADQSDADYVDTGAQNVLGTDHDIPTTIQCGKCHTKAPERILGVTALQLGNTTSGLTVASLVKQGLLSAPPATTLFNPPGNPTEVAALGYIHANCGNCHNETDVKPLNLRVSVKDTTVMGTQLYQTSVNVVGEWMDPSITHIVTPGDPSTDSLWVRMNIRGSDAQMPPTASKDVDMVGLAAVGAWIKALQ